MNPTRLVICYNPGKNIRYCPKGLGITALNIQKYMRSNGFNCEVWPIAGGDVLESILALPKNESVTHVVVQAPWIPTSWFQSIALKYVNIKFACTSHSNVGFLQAESQAITLLRQYADLALLLPNFFCAGNNEPFCNWMKNAYGRACLYLPNLYFIDPKIPQPAHPLWNGGTLRIGCFGAGRAYKNFQSAVAAAVLVSRQLKATTEIWLNSGRTDGHGNIVWNSATATTENLTPGVSLEPLKWSEWPAFRSLVSNMHLLMQPSFTESFNNVTADGILEGVPSVVSSAIRFVPSTWIADSDDVNDIATKARHLISDIHAADEGMAALRAWNAAGFVQWVEFLS